MTIMRAALLQIGFRERGPKQKSGGHRGDNGSPLCPVASFSGEGGWELTTQPAELSTERIVPGGTKKRFGNL
jgi:hypothetical protein